MALSLFRGLRRCTAIMGKTTTTIVVASSCRSGALCDPDCASAQLRLFATNRSYGTQRVAEAEKPAATAVSSAEPSPLDIFGDNKDERREEKEKAIKNLKIGFFFIGASVIMIVGSGLYVLMDEDKRYRRDEKDKERDSYAVVRVLKRARVAAGEFFESMRAPSYEKLLPDPLPYPYVQPPYTLIVEMTDLLVHPEWTYSTGWRFKKRPNVDQFLESVSQHYEVVVFTASNGFNVYPILDSLDKNNVIMYRLVKNATDYIGGHHVKNLDRINRDLSRVIVVDWNADSVKLQRENALVIPRWTGEDEDQQLIQLAEFLSVVSASEVNDVRDVLSYYKQFDNPLEVFKENQRKLLEMQEEQKQISGTLPVNKARGSWKDKYLYGR